MTKSWKLSVWLLQDLFFLLLKQKKTPENQHSEQEMNIRSSGSNQPYIYFHVLQLRKTTLSKFNLMSVLVLQWIQEHLYSLLLYYAINCSLSRSPKPFLTVSRQIISTWTHKTKPEPWLSGQWQISIKPTAVKKVRGVLFLTRHLLSWFNSLQRNILLLHMAASPIVKGQPTSMAIRELAN